MARHDRANGLPPADCYEASAPSVVAAPAAVTPPAVQALEREQVTPAGADSDGIGGHGPSALHIPEGVGEIVSAPAFSIAPVGSLMLKRAVDIMVGLVGLVITVGLFPIVLLVVSLDSRGPVIYGQRRVGRDMRRRPGDSADGRRSMDYGGRPFTVYKLRTMRCDAERDGPRLAVSGDPRTTRVGAFLRRYHIDEWPQFMCILSGDMSLVGPRPERPFFAVRYRDEVPRYRLRTAGIRPGLIGVSQVLVGYDHSMASIRAKAELDARYRELLLGSTCRWPAADTRVVVQTARYMCGCRPPSDLQEDALEPILAEQHNGRAG
jgi:lipopolysaccharide/colanic/teichoic acid biosynthesis glycosyltransferase